MHSKYDVKYVRKCRLCLEVVDVYYIFPCMDKRYLDDAGKHVIDYLDNLENGEYMRTYMYYADDGDSGINVCKIIYLLNTCGGRQL